ncbi:hypothetical protein D3C72_2230570 [compost metagenome]
MQTLHVRNHPGLQHALREAAADIAATGNQEGSGSGHLGNSGKKLRIGGVAGDRQTGVAVDRSSLEAIIAIESLL